jgi:hypothetical protein
MRNITDEVMFRFPVLGLVLGGNFARKFEERARTMLIKFAADTQL